MPRQFLEVFLSPGLCQSGPHTSWYVENLFYFSFDWAEQDHQQESAGDTAKHHSFRKCFEDISESVLCHPQMNFTICNAWTVSYFSFKLWLHRFLSGPGTILLCILRSIIIREESLFLYLRLPVYHLFSGCLFFRTVLLSAVGLRRTDK